MKNKLIKSSLQIFLMIICTVFSCEISQDKSSIQGKRHKHRDTIDSLLSESVDLMKIEDYSRTEKVLSHALDLAKKSRDSLSLADVWNNLGLLKFYTDQHDSSIAAYQKALVIAREVKRLDKEAITLKNLGISYKKKNLNELAIISYRDALLIAESQNDSNEVASINNGIGVLYNNLKNYPKSLDHSSRALLIWTTMDKKDKMMIALGNKGNALLGLKRVEDAIDTYQKTLELKKSYASKYSFAITLNNLGEAFAEKGDLSAAEKQYLKSIDLRREVNRIANISLVENNLAELAMRRKNYAKAQKRLDQAKLILQQYPAPDNELENTRLQKELYALTGKFKKAYETDLKYDSLKQTNFDEEIIKVKDQQYAYDLDQEAKAKELFKARLASSEAQRESQRLRSRVQTYALIIIILIAIIISYLALKLRKKNNHIENLMRELHHRVKNHLGMISGMFGAQSEQGTTSNADLLEEAKTRVEAVNGIHRRLYRQDEYEFVNMQEYLTELVDNSALVFGLYHNIQKELNIDSEPLAIDKAISVGLIANEVLTNAFKYGLQKTEKPLLKVVLEKAVKGYRMVIFNNAEPDHEPLMESTGFGKELIKRLTANLKGESRTTEQNGFRFELTFP